MKFRNFYAAPEVPRLGDLGGFQCKSLIPNPSSEGEGSLATEVRIITQQKMKFRYFYAAPEVPRLGDLGGCGGKGRCFSAPSLALPQKRDGDRLLQCCK